MHHDHPFQEARGCKFAGKGYTEDIAKGVIKQLNLREGSVDNITRLLNSSRGYDVLVLFEGKHFKYQPE
jgi:hypothetical protein